MGLDTGTGAASASGAGGAGGAGAGAGGGGARRTLLTRSVSRDTEHQSGRMEAR